MDMPRRIGMERRFLTLSSRNMTISLKKYNTLIFDVCARINLRALCRLAGRIH